MDLKSIGLFSRLKVCKVNYKIIREILPVITSSIRAVVSGHRLVKDLKSVNQWQIPLNSDRVLCIGKNSFRPRMVKDSIETTASIYSFTK
jgi:hypothetical protein